MGSDRARVSYDPNQHYRSVVMQQGRVTLEADWNENQAIFGEELRQETLEIVGPAGTPDDGYRVVETHEVPDPLFDFFIKSGTMYVGGVRLALDDPVRYSQQPDWLDHDGDPEWSMPGSESLPSPPTNEYVYLLVREQEVSAVEDSALRDVALGGPDTAARTRMMQRFVRLGTQSNDCAGGRAAAVAYWTSKGLAWDVDLTPGQAAPTMRLLPQSTLQASFDTTSKPGPCEPQAAGGYLAADNQLIRIQISGPDTIVWGFDDASFLYQVNIASDGQTLTLQSQPVDAFHQPRNGQTVEVLRSAAILSNGEFVASATGVIQTLTKAYDQDHQQITLPNVLPWQYIDSTETPRAFLRVWEQEIQFPPKIPIELGDTGLYVTLDTWNNAPFHVGDYWLIAVRPNKPDQVYPQRYLEGPQPPDGPRMWACPLAAIHWEREMLKVDEDCRQHFCTLVKACSENAGGCCTITLSPADLTGDQALKSILSPYQDRAEIRVCLLPGVYELQDPLRLGPERSNLTLEGCHDGVVLTVAAGSENKFADGIIVLNQANNVTLRCLRFKLPQVLKRAGAKLLGLDPSIFGRSSDLFTSIGVRPVHCANLTITDCLFRYSVTPDQHVFGAGIFAGSECWGLKVQGNRFVHEEEDLRNGIVPIRGQDTTSVIRMLIGYVLSPTIASVPRPSVAARPKSRARARASAVTLSEEVRSVLQDAVFHDNAFLGLSIAALVCADCDVVKFEDNTVRESYAGFWIVSLATLKRLPAVAIPTDLLEAMKKKRTAARIVPAPTLTVLNVAAGVVCAYPLPAGFDIHHALRAVRSGGHRLELSLQVANNDIDAFVPNGPSGAGLLVVGDWESPGGTMTMSANKIRAQIQSENRFDAAAMVILNRYTVTGNVIANGLAGQDSGGLSLATFGGTTATVTGNVFVGTPLLPLRVNVPAPLDNWEVFNTKV